MCDCPKKDQKELENVGPETVTLFEKCRKLSSPGRDILDHPTYDVLNDTDDGKWRTVRYLQSDSSDDAVCGISNRSCTSESSTDTRTYKFVSPRECECRGEPEEIPRPVLFEPREVRTKEAEETPDVECTLAIIKPEAVPSRKQIEQRVFEEGFEICQTRWLQLTPEQASEFYSDCYGQLDFAHLVAYMSSGPIVVHVLSKERAVDDWRYIIGPTKVTEARLYCPDSIRAKYGRRGEDFKNAVHGSVSREQAEREIHFFFPEMVIEPLLKDEAASDYLWEVINSVLVEGLSLCCKRKPADPILWLAHWLLLNNPNKPRLPESLALTAS